MAEHAKRLRIAKLKEGGSTQNTVNQNDNTGTNIDGNTISVTEAEKILAKYIGEGNSTMAYGLNASYR
ncbi:hypothetical protein IJG28_00065 [Candidatus Saccharibacteria bacterium]|nr:hypothetical protein [Candidatus Saccharibacteria bacterium]